MVNELGLLLAERSTPATKLNSEYSAVIRCLAGVPFASVPSFGSFDSPTESVRQVIFEFQNVVPDAGSTDQNLSQRNNRSVTRKAEKAFSAKVRYRRDQLFKLFCHEHFHDNLFLTRCLLFCFNKNQ